MQRNEFCADIKAISYVNISSASGYNLNCFKIRVYSFCVFAVNLTKICFQACCNIGSLCDMEKGEYNQEMPQLHTAYQHFALH